jgi:hypothetical protein
MTKSRVRGLISAPGAESRIEAKSFFSNTGMDATVFLDHLHPMSVTQKKKYGFFWELLKANRPIWGMLEPKVDSNNLPYVWVTVEQLRGRQEFKIYLLAPRLLDLLIRYQNGGITIRFTLDELIEEAHRIEDEQS